MIGELERPTISIQSSPKTYGHFTLRPDTWISKTGATHELNISAGTLARPIEMVCATMCHELCHYYAYVHQIKDVSRNYTYHNKRFKAIAEEHGLTVTHSEKYGWSHTEPGDLILDFVLTNELTDILLFRNEFCGISIGGTGGHSSSGNATVPQSANHPAPGSINAPAAEIQSEPQKPEYCLSGLPAENGFGIT